MQIKNELTDPSTTTALGDRFERDLRACELQLHDYGAHKTFCGRVVTFRSNGDNMQLKDMINQSGQGRIIVVDVGGNLSGAMVGDRMAARAAENGWAGFVINGAVRDVNALKNVPIGIKAVGHIPRRSRKSGSGEQNCAVEFGTVEFTPNHFLFADEDGVVVLDPDAYFNLET